jgi:phosphotransferase system enzyme I (PtsI)
VPAFSDPSVIVAEDLAPAETATLDRSLVVGIITEAGGRTSHTAILAAQMGIPAVVQLPGATAIAAGTPVALDGDSGEVTTWRS